MCDRLAIILIAIFLFGASAVARDQGQWNEASPEIRTWFNGLMQPDRPTSSCCGQADAYWADSYEVNGSEYVAIVTDERPDMPLGRPHLAIGTRITVPNSKIKWDQGNPTGHGVIFLSADSHAVFCYVPPGGV